METGYFNKDNYDDAEELTSIAELKSYDVGELRDVLDKNGMNVLECRSIGSLTHLYLIHLYRQNTADDVHEKSTQLVQTKIFSKFATITINLLCLMEWVALDEQEYLQ